MRVPVRKFLIFVALLFPLCASGWLITENGPDPILVQVKQSIRLAPDLEAQLQDLVALETSLGVSVTGLSICPTAYIQTVAFPADFTEGQIQSVIGALLQSQAVEQVVPIWAFNLSFRLGDFGQQFGPTDTIPEAVLRGLDTPPPQPVDPDLLNHGGPYVPNQLEVSWKPEFVWNAAQTGFLQTIADFNAAGGCRVLDQRSELPANLYQTLEFDPNQTSLLDELIRYTNSGLVEWVAPVSTGFIALVESQPSGVATPVRRHSKRARHHKGSHMQMHDRLRQ